MTTFLGAMEENSRLRARLAEVEAERDRISAYNDKRYHDCTKVQDGLRAAEARLAAVLALCDVEDPEMTFPEWQQAVRAAAQGDGRG